MEDPLRLLVGSGQGIRHVRVHDLESPPESVLRDFLRQGIQLSGHQIASDPSSSW